VPTFTGFTDPYATTSFEAQDPAHPDFTEHNPLVDSMGREEFALLLRTVELVVQAQAYSTDKLSQALRIHPHNAQRMTLALESVGVISPVRFDGHRAVVAQARDLPMLLARLLTTTGDPTSAKRAS
jgi:hypothetical protein